jgi:hypothetical protein
MNSVTINTISLNPYYIIYVCDIYGNNCVFNSIIPQTVPPSITIGLPSQFQNVSAVGIKIVNGENCEKFEVVLCNNLLPSPTVTPTFTPTPTLTQTPTPTTAVSLTPTPTLTQTPASSLTPTPTPTPTNTLTPTPSGAPPCLDCSMEAVSFQYQ